MKWTELTRAEKTAHLFDYPYPDRLKKVKELWGEKASEYGGTVYFPFMTPWEEIIAVMKQTGEKQYVYVKLGVNDFGVITNEDIMNKEDESLALVRWHDKVMNDAQPVLLGFEMYDEKTLICRVCTEEGYRGDEDGFGVEPDMWASALLDFEGKVIGPFRPGYTYKP